MNHPRFTRLTAGLMGLLAATGAFAQSHPTEPQDWQLNMTRGVTVTAANAYQGHMIMLWICVVIGIIVFGAMAYSMFAFRKSKGAKADTDFTHSTKLELIWTTIPILILIGSAIPATRMVMAEYDASHDPKPYDMTVKITGLQWLWRYEYVGQDVAFTSRLDRESDALRQNPNATQAQIRAKEHYLRDVDHPLVLPVDTRIHFVITGDDVIHAWWVPALGWKQDAIPGVINDQWTEVHEPGTYRGVCAELCGKDHGFMPIVVKVVPKAEYQAWLASQKPAPATPTPAPVAPAAAVAPVAVAAN